MGDAQIHCVEGHTGAVELDSRLFRDEKLAVDHRRSHQCHQTCHGAGRCTADFRRATERLAMGWCADGNPLVFPIEEKRKERRY